MALRARVIGVAVLPLLTVLAGCAGRAASGGGTAARHERSASLLSRAAAPLPSTSAAPVATAAVCRGRGAGFALSLAISSGGAPNPIAAARRFVRHGGVTGFGTVRSVWRVASTPPVTRDEATVLDGRVSLHAVRLRDRTWAVDEGSRCG